MASRDSCWRKNSKSKACAELRQNQTRMTKMTNRTKSWQLNRDTEKQEWQNPWVLDPTSNCRSVGLILGRFWANSSRHVIHSTMGWYPTSAKTLLSKESSSASSRFSKLGLPITICHISICFSGFHVLSSLYWASCGRALSPCRHWLCPHYLSTTATDLLWFNEGGESLWIKTNIRREEFRKIKESYFKTTVEDWVLRF